MALIQEQINFIFDKEKTLARISGASTPTNNISGKKSEFLNNISGTPFPAASTLQ